MLKHLEDNAPFYVLVAFLAILAVVGYVKHPNQQDEACVKRGGVVVILRNGNICLDPKAFK
jgi:hypothetical protein